MIEVESAESALDALPPGPWTVGDPLGDDSPVVASDGRVIAVLPSAEAEALARLRNAAVTLARIAREARPAPAAPAPRARAKAGLAVPAGEILAGVVATLRPLVATAPPPPRESAETERQKRVEIALARGCPAHEPTMLAALDPQPTRAIEYVQAALRWHRSATPSVRGLTRGAVAILAGPSDGGKTVALSHAVATFRGGYARYVRAGYIADLPTNDYSAYVEERQKLVEYSVLAIDEAGVELPKHAGTRIAAILHARYDAGKITFVATNLAAKTFVERYFAYNSERGADQRFLSRLSVEQESGGLPPWCDVSAVGMRRKA